MSIVRYKTQEGKIYNVESGQEQLFIQKFPGAVLMPKLETEKQANARKEKQMREAMKIAYAYMPQGQVLPKWAIPLQARLYGGTAGLASGVLEAGEVVYENIIGMSKEEMLQDGLNPVSKSLRDIEGFYDMFYTREYDDAGNELRASDLYEKGDAASIAKGLNISLEQGIESLPTMIASYVNPFWGGALMGVSTMGTTFKDDLENRPDLTLAQLNKNAAWAGGAEWIGEYLGGTWFRSMNAFDPTGANKAVVKELTGEFIEKFIGRTFGSAVSEAASETITAVMQTAGNQYFYKDAKTTGDYIHNIVNAVVPAIMLGGSAGAISSVSPVNRQEIYKYVSPAQWKEKALKIGHHIHETEKDLENANDKLRPKFEEKLKKLKEQQKAHEQKLFNAFNSMSDKQLNEYAENLDVINKNVEIITSGNYSQAAIDQAKKDNYNLLKGNLLQLNLEGNFDVSFEQLVGEALKTSEIIENRLKKAKGINKSDLDIQILRTDEEINEAVKRIGTSAKTNDGIFIGKNENGKATIYINKKVASVAGATNVLGHELLHYMISRKFKTDNKSMQPLIDELKSYLKENYSEEYKQVSQRINNHYTDKQTGKIKDGALEEYLNVFSDLIDKKKIDLQENNSKGIVGGVNDVMLGFGFGEVKLNSAEDVIKFLSTYNKNINRQGLLGKLMGVKMIDVGLTSDLLVEGQDKKSSKKSSLTAKDIAKKTLDEIGKSENFDPSNKEITNQLPGMVKVQVDNYFNNRPSLKADNPVREEVRAEILFRLINPSKTGRTDINGFKPKINDSLYGYLNKRINYRMLDTFKENPTIVPDFTKVDLEDAAKFLTTEDVATTKKTEGVKTKLVQTKARQLTNLADLDVESSALIKETTKTQLAELIKSNPKNLVQEIQNVLIPDLVEIVRKEMGVIGEKKGELVIPESYKAYLAETYGQTISSMEILKIRTNYKNLFKRENMGFADYKTKKSDKPSLKKDSNYRKEIFRNVTTKAEFTKYHTEGKKNKLIANQRNLALMRAEAEAVQAADNYIIENSNDLNQVYAAELRKYIDSKTVEKQKLEDKSFDSVKFSKTRQEQQVELTQKSLKQVKDLVNLIDNNAITDVFNLETQQPIKGKYDPEVVQIVFNQFLKGNIYSNRHKALVDIIKKIPKNLLKGNLGTAIEQYKINVGNKAAKKYEGLTMLGEWVQEGGIPDFFADIHGFALYAEAKFGKSRGGKVSTNFTNWLTGKFKINKRLEGNIEFVEKSVKKALKNAGKLVKDLKDLDFDLVDQDTVVDLKTHKELGAKKAIVSDASVVVDADYIGRIYANKEYPVYLIDIDGAGLFYIPGDPFIETLAKELGIPKLEGKFPLITRILPQRVEKNGVKVGYKYKLTTEPLIDPNNIKVKSDFSLSDMKTFDAIMNSKAVAGLKKEQEAKGKQILSSATKASRTVSNPKGITVLDFDDTLATTKSLVRYTAPDGATGTLNAEEYANSYQGLLEQGYTFDFSEFNKVVKGKIAPLFQKALKLQSKFGPENMFVLTARPPQAQKAIFDFLKANGLNIPLKNITGLGNSTAEAKALWIADKVGEGYNDFYFADDALQNVQAVDNMLEQFDVKRKVQQAKVKFSNSMSDQFNKILEDITGIEAFKKFDFIKARKRGASKGKFRLFIPPSHEDFVGLLYNFMGKGRKGDAHRNFLEQALVRPLNRANREYDTARQSVATDYKNLNKQMPDVKKKLLKKTPDGDFIYQDAIRVYIWDKHGYNIPGLSPIDQKNLVELVKSDSRLQAYAETINTISKQETYVDPTDGWDSGDIRMDLDDATGRIGRAQFFEEFIENANIIFSTENLNKIEAGYGKGVREALEDMLYRIKTGRNKPTGQSGMVNTLMNWVNGSVGSVMFFNMRSALLQQMSLVNYINFADNNIFAAAKAFANQKQYWADWAFIFNSDMLKQRRGGIMTDVNGAELAAEMRKSKNPHRFLISKLLQLGFLPTQIGDNIAIATGGATYYRNRINTYLKEGLSKKEAEAKAFTDFQNITQSTQQSARPDMVSQQQASIIGKVILNFQNVTSQFNRLGKKAFLDIKNRRITGPNKTQMQSDISNAARITYYFAVQNAIFYTLQTALFAMLFDDDEDDPNNLFLKKQERLINGSIDSVLRGTGITGAVISTLKNVAIAFARQRDVNYNPDESAVVVEALNFSPVLGIKARKIVNAEKTLNYNKKVINEMNDLDIDNPQWSAVTNYIEGFTNLPLNRLYNKTQNVRQGFNNEHAAWERMLMFLGWSQYNLNLENTKIENIKKQIKEKSKQKTKTKTRYKSRRKRKR